jgi:Domain of unknown function (DUF4404)
MDKNKLRELLAELHRELGGAGPVDAESRQLLDELLRDIQKLSSETPGAIPDGATTQLREAALRLESAHPRLANVIGQLTDTLAKLGI